MNDVSDNSVSACSCKFFSNSGLLLYGSLSNCLTISVGRFADVVICDALSLGPMSSI